MDRHGIRRFSLAKHGGGSRGILLVEVLVVVCAVALVIALALPSILSTRESARRSECSSNQIKLALGMASYDAKRRMLPGWRNTLHIAGTPNDQASEVTWLVAILPYLHQFDIYHGIVQHEVWRVDDSDCTHGGWHAKSMARCATAPVPLGFRPDKTHYRAAAAQTVTDTGVNGVVLPLERDDAALIDNVGLWAGTKSAADIAAADGLAKTLLVSECQSDENWVPLTRIGARVGSAQATGATNPPLADVREAGRNGQAVRTAATLTRPGDHHAALTFSFPFGTSGVVPPTMQVVNSARLAPSSYHHRGVNVVFADGHAAFLTNNLAPRVYGHMVTSRSIWDRIGAANKKFVTNSVLANRFLLSGSTAATEPFSPEEGEDF